MNAIPGMEPASRRIDFHTHILPELDDGSQSVEESVQMLHTSMRQGVWCIVATPHFYATSDYPEHFLQKREQKLQKLRRAQSYAVPLVIPGAEVQYFEGITGMKELSQMRIAKSPCLLIEMPFGLWSERMIQDVLELHDRPGYCVVLAHIERYLRWQKESVWKRFADAGVQLQVSAGYFCDRATMGKAFRLLDRGMVHVLGSDCHNMTSRPPNLGLACERIAQKRGEDTVQMLMKNSIRLLLQNTMDES